MGLPKVSFKINSESLGGFTATTDNICGLVCAGADVSGNGNLKLNTTYRLTSLASLTALGVTNGNNALVYRHVSDFYKQTNTGAVLYLRVVATSVPMQDYTDKTKTHAVALLNDAKGEVNILGISKGAVAISGGGSAIALVDGLQGVTATVATAQALAEDFLAKSQPLSIVIDGVRWSGSASDLKDYSAAGTKYNKVSVLLGSDIDSNNSCVGLFLGEVAKLPVQRSVARVLNGAVSNVTDPYFTNKAKVSTNTSDWETIHDKRYIFFRSYAGRTNFYFNSDSTLAEEKNDLKSIALNRVLDKVVRIAFVTYTSRLYDEVEVDTSGKLAFTTITTLSNDIESVLTAQMVNENEIIRTRVSIDPDQNVQATGKVRVKVRIVPYGYFKEIEVDLGFSKG